MSRELVIALVLVIGASDAFAQSASDEYATGQRLYAAHDYLGAAKHFEAAYKLDPDPAYLFNIAQAYRLGDDCAHAAEWYQRFLDRAQDPPNAAEVRTQLEQQRACAKQKALLAPKSPPPPPPPPARSTAAARDPKRTYAYVAGGVGVAALAVAGVFTWDGNYLANAREERCNADHPCDDPIFEDYEHRGKRANIIAATSYAVGGAALAGGVALYLLSRSRLAVVPTHEGVSAMALLHF
jgi:tetratricopeptide (TPR) repeat protein